MQQGHTAWLSPCARRVAQDGVLALLQHHDCTGELWVLGCLSCPPQALPEPGRQGVTGNITSSCPHQPGLGWS